MFAIYLNRTEKTFVIRLIVGPESYDVMEEWELGTDSSEGFLDSVSWCQQLAKGEGWMNWGIKVEDFRQS